MRSISIVGRVGIALLALGFAVPAAAEEPVIDEVLGILKDRGLVDEEKYNELVARNDAYEEKNESLLGRIEWSGDFRGRLENFWYDKDDLGNNRDNRTRGRYRLRIGGKAQVNDWTSVYFRLASGEDDQRSTNRTLGKDNDFGPDDIFIDRAYLELKAPSEYVPLDGSLKLLMGKTKNVFRWKKGKDYMLWDSDINPEGVGVQYSASPFDGTTFFANAGYYILDENSTEEDPHVLGLQGGVHVAASDTVTVGGRVSWYSWRSLNPAFLGRQVSTGNLADFTGLGDGFEAGELAGYLEYTGIEDWPVLVYGHYARNFSAGDAIAGSGDEDTGWGVGLEIGDKKKYVKLGTGFYVLEANFWPSQFIDSDLTDGFANRQGWTVYGSRQILPNTDLNVTFFMSEDLETDLPAFARSVRNAERMRLQTDIVVKF